MAHRTARLVILVPILLGAAASATAFSTYTFTTIDAPGLTNTVATDINNLGEIVGYGTGSSSRTGFLDNAGHFTNISVAGSSSTMVNGLNDIGQIVGNYSNSAFSHGFEYSAGSYTAINAGMNAVPGTTMLVGINNSGQIAGNAIIPDVILGTASAGFVESAGLFKFVPWGPGGFLSLAGINDSGEIVGNAGGIGLPNDPIFGTAASVLLASSFPFGSTFNAINDNGQIVVNSGYIVPSPSYTMAGALITYPGSVSTTILGINNAGWLVGDYVDSSDVQHAFEAIPTPEPTYTALVASVLLVGGLFPRLRSRQ